jgi:cell division protein FtsB
MRSIWKPLVLVFLISFLGIVSSCSYSQDNGELTNQYNALVQKYNSLLQQNNDLTQQNNVLVQQNNALVQQNNNYRASMEQLSNEVDKYNKQLQSALEGAILPPYITMNGRKASYAFRNLDNKVESWSFDVETLEANTITGTFMRNLDISELNRLGLSSIAQRFISGTKFVTLGGKFTRIDCRPYIVKENFQNSTSNFYSRHTDDESRIKEVWNMVIQLCPYVGELKETPRLPLETLLFGGGDCEDVAILTASILKAMSSNWTVELVYMDSDNPTSYKTINHVSVFVDTGTYKTFVESTQKDNMSPYQSVDGFYVKVP